MKNFLLVMMGVITISACSGTACANYTNKNQITVNSDLDMKDLQQYEVTCGKRHNNYYNCGAFNCDNTEPHTHNQTRHHINYHY